jgi:photosystem II stability/assembly factor-like uncharacterized protein
LTAPQSLLLRRTAALSPALAALLLAEPLQANGRFPAADQLVVNPADPTHLVLRTTYGLIQSTDKGQDWRWICEAAIGYGGMQDPAIAITADGTLVAGVIEGLGVSHDRGCSWTFAGGPLAGETVADASVERMDPSRAVALTKTAISGGYHVIVAESLDNGHTWTQAGVPIQSDLFPFTIDTAPSAPARMYVSGVAGAAFTPVIERSDDRGMSWTRLPLAPEYAKTIPYLSAVDPIDPDRLYVRLDGSDRDQVLVSTDGAQTFTSIHASVLQGDLLGFALSPDGSRIAIGGPADGLLVCDTINHAFQPASSLSIRSLTWAEAGLYASLNELTDGMTVGLSTDEGKTFSPVHHMAEMCLIDCPAATSAALCVESWPVIAATLGADVTCGQGSSSSSTASATSSGGATGSAPPPEGPGSCGCRLAEPQSPTAAWFAAVGLLVGRRRGFRKTAKTPRTPRIQITWRPWRLGGSSISRPAGPEPRQRLELPSAKSTVEISCS